MRFLIAGLGSIGQRHLRNLIALGERDIVLLRTGRGALPLSDEFSGLTVETDLARALKRGPDAVLVANPTAFHLDIAIPAARAGCHLLIEKPVSHTADGLEALTDAVSGGGGEVLIGYQYRFHPLLARMHEVARAGGLGTLRWAIAHWGHHLPDWHPWEDYRTGYAARRDLGGGVLLTLSHPLDYLQWIVGPLTCSQSRIQVLGGLAVDVDDYVDLWLQRDNTFTAAVHLDYYQRPAEHWLALGGDSGSLRLDFIKGRLVGATHDIDVDMGVAPGFDRNDMYLDEMRHFLRVAKGLEAPACNLNDGLASLRLVLSARANQV